MTAKRTMKDTKAGYQYQKHVELFVEVKNKDVSSGIVVGVVSCMVDVVS